MKVLMLLFALMVPISAAAGEVGQITGLKGVVQLRSKNNLPYGELRPGTLISEGNWIRTGANGWVELTLKDKSRFTLANDTEFEVNGFLLTDTRREGSFNLAQGKLRASVVKLAGRQSGMTVRSGTAVAGIKGTEFLMLSQGPANLFFGNEGNVSISGGSTGNAQALLAGTMTQNTRGAAPIGPLKIEPGTPLAEAKGIFERVTAASPPDEWKDSGRIADIIARWNINHGHYLADSGKYEEALHVFQIALDLTTVPEVRADAHMERGAVYARFLNNPELSMAEYLLVMEEYPRLPQAETALFHTAQTLMELRLVEQARSRFEQYLKQYPAGRHRGSVETLLKSLAR